MTIWPTLVIPSITRPTVQRFVTPEWRNEKKEHCHYINNSKINNINISNILY